MDASQLDRLLNSKINRSRSARRVSFVAVAALCLLLVVGAGAGIYYLANRETPDEIPAVTAQDAVEQPSDTRQLQDSSETNDAVLSVPDEAQKDSDDPPSAPEDDELVPNGVQEDGLYTHSLQMVWFEDPLYALPEELNISVSCEEDIITEFTLTPENGWQYTWSDPYSADELTLQGDFPQDIFAVFSVSGQNFTVTGIYSDPPASEEDKTSDANLSEEPEKRELPRTGMVWPFGLLAAGLALVIAGTCQKRAHGSRE